MRNKQIDILRFLGLSLIILAHVDPPTWVFQLRNFDVPLMVLVSGLAYMQSTPRDSYGLYVWKRVKRLVFPVWLFLACYFLLIWITGADLEKLTITRVFGSFALMEGIGYVWIIRVFLLVALAAPFILALNKQIESNGMYLSLLLLTFLVYELVLYSTSPVNSQGFGALAASLGYYGTAFSLVFALGIRLDALQSREVIAITLVSSLAFVGLAGFYFINQGGVVTTQAFKYPPSAYYLSYALAASLLLWLLTKNVHEHLQAFNAAESAVMFIAQNSIWIYLWHIPFAKIVQNIAAGSFLSKYVLVYSLSALITHCQVMLVKRSILPGIGSEATRKNIKTVLTG